MSAKNVLQRVSGHAWTLLPQVSARLWAPPPSEFTLWSTTLEDPDVGTLRLTGELRDVPSADALCVLVHGLGGGPDSLSCRRAARELQALGYPTLNLALRGADLCGEDFYNVGQTEDLCAALGSAELAHYTRILVLGFSMGGHAALRLLTGPLDPRVRGVAAVCSPLYLESLQRLLDRPRAAVYRHHVLGGLKAIYAAVAARRTVPTPWETLRRARTIRQWDELAIVPRYGFRDVRDCYERLAVGPRLRDLRAPALLVAAEGDPIVPADLLRRQLPRRCDGLDVRWTRRGGHLFFARDLDLGFGDRRGLIGQVAAWFEEVAGRSP